MKIHFTDIVWDTGGDKTIRLPTSATLEVDDNPEDIAMEGADILSDAYGWCVISFNWEEPNELQS